MGMIFSFSHDTGDQSSKKSDAVILQVSSFFGFSSLSKTRNFLDIFVVPVRKSAHFLIYFILGILLFSFLREFSNCLGKLFILSIFLSFLYACSDEIHQLFVPGRSGRIFDVLLDTAGATLGIFLFYLLSKRKAKQINEVIKQ